MVKTLSFYGRARIMAFIGTAAILASAAVQADAGLETKWFGAWDYVMRHDAEGQPLAAFARLHGENGSLLWLTCQRQVIESDRPPVRFIAAAVAQKQYLGFSGSQGRSTVYWFDGGSPEVGHWIYRERHGQIMQPEQVHAFVDKLSGARSLTIELSNYRYETKKLEFHLNATDSRDMADRFRKDCRSIVGDNEG